MHIAPSNRFTLLALVIMAAGVFLALVFGADRLAGVVSPGPSPWQNKALPMDVNASGIVNQTDYNELKAYLNDPNTPKVYKANSLPHKKHPNVKYPDINGTRSVDVKGDLKGLEYFLNNNPQPKPEGEGSTACQKTRWCNTGRPEDVNNDGQINQEDVVDLQEYIDSSMPKDFTNVSKAFAATFKPYPRYPDVSGDGNINPTDLNMIITWIASPQPRAEPEGEPPNAAWHNKAFPADVNNDKKADEKDPTAVLAYLSSTAPKSFSASHVPTPRFPDAKKDGVVDQKDYTFVSDWVVNPSPWQNPSIAEDVNNDNVVNRLDAEVLQRYIDSDKSEVVNLPSAPSASAYYPDVNGDRLVNTTDAIQVINKVGKP